MAERHLTSQRRAAASPAAVWAVFADFPNLADHWDGLKGSRLVGDQRQGVGARREVDLAPFGSMVETVTVWEEGRTLTTTNQPSRLVPLKQAEARLTLEPAGDGTAMTFDYRYVPKGGPMGRLIGPVIDRLAAGLLERHVAGCAEHGSGKGLPGPMLRPGDSKIEDVNIAALVDEAASAIAIGQYADKTHQDLARHIFGAVGKVSLNQPSRKTT